MGHFLAEVAEFRVRYRDAGGDSSIATKLINRHIDHIWSEMSSTDGDRMLAEMAVPAHVKWPPLPLSDLETPKQKDASVASSSSGQPPQDAPTLFQETEELVREQQVAENARPVSPAKRCRTGTLRCATTASTATAAPVRDAGDARMMTLPLAEGSQGPCTIFGGLASERWIACTVEIPPLSSSLAERIGSQKTLLFSVISAEPGKLWATVGGEEIRDLGSADNFVVRSREEYMLRNDSGHEKARLKLVVLYQHDVVSMADGDGDVHAATGQDP